MAETLQQIRARLNKTSDKGMINKCKECGFKIRGVNHEEGNHHRKISVKHSR